jgi:hypothetical protein
LIHGSGPRKRSAEEENPKKLKQCLKEVESQLPEPAQMTMRDIIRRAEAIERKVTAAFFSFQKILLPAISSGLRPWHFLHLLQLLDVHLLLFLITIRSSGDCQCYITFCSNDGD